MKKKLNDMKKLKALFISTLFIASLPLFSCSRSSEPEETSGVTVINFVHSKISGSDVSLNNLLREFEKQNPGVRIEETILPNSTDQQHQTYIIELGSRAEHIDIMAIDVIWVAEFAKAGWILPVGSDYHDEEKNNFITSSLQACTFEDKLYAIPWFIDGGVIYYRKDLLKKYGFDNPPETFQELIKQVEVIKAGENNPSLNGLVMQARQYEGLVCNFLELLWGFGGEVLDSGNNVILDKSDAALKALTYLRELKEKKIIPDYVTTFDEEASRNTFQSGRAVFMRNWPYVWTLSNQEGSPVKDKFFLSLMPHAEGVKEGATTLGGFNLAVNRFSKYPDLSLKLIKYLTTSEAQREIVLDTGLFPTRHSLYSDQKLLKEQPTMEVFYPILQKTKPRPVSPYYPQISAVMQSEISSVLADVHTPEEAVREMAKQIRFIME